MSAVASVPDPMFPRPYRVHRVTKETSDTFTLELLPEAGHAPSPGTTFRQADLARTLTAIRDQGRDGF